MSHFSKAILALGIGLLVILIYQYPSYCFPLFKTCYFVGEPIIQLNVSNDGRYVISSDNKGWVTLWDIQQKTKKILTQKAGAYGVGWVSGKELFYWQDRETYEVQVQDIQGHTVQRFNTGAQIFGSALDADLQYYAQGVSTGGGCYYFVMNLAENKPAYHPENSDRYVLCGWNPYHFQFLSKDLLFISNDALFLNQIKDNLDTKLKDLVSYDGTIGTAFATVSPDGKYVVGGQEGGRALVWHTETGKLAFELYDLYLGKLERSTSDWREDLLHVKLPEDFEYRTAIERGVISIKFIDKTHYLLFPERAYKSSNNDHAYAVLYDLLDPSPLKYLSLGKSPKPALQYFQRDQAIDTSSQAHILVMAKENEGGILVYRYDPEKQTLTKIWEAR